MMWLGLILGGAIAVPLLSERNRREMDDAARGAGPGQFAELPQGVTHFEWHGPADGRVLICVHGLTTPSFVWRGLTAGLVKLGFRVLTYDLYGRGFSDRPAGPQNAAFFMRQLTDLMTHQQVRGRVTLMGYSMGGAICACYAAAHPDRVRHLVLLAPAGMHHAIGGAVRFIRDTPLIGDVIMLAAYPRLLRKGIDGADQVIPLSALGTLAEWNRDVEHDVIEGAGHGLTYTHSDQVLQTLDGWLARQKIIKEFT